MNSLELMFLLSFDSHFDLIHSFLNFFLSALSINNTSFIFIDLDEVSSSKMLHAHLSGCEHVFVVYYCRACHSSNVLQLL